jgi:hypothetical protein
MDQAASVISTTSSALYVTFFPKLAALPTPLPASKAVFICANSLVVSDKVVHARTRYNLRVVETLVAARVLARRLSLPLDTSGKYEKITLREVVGRLVGEKPGEEMPIEQLKEVLERMGKEVELLRPEGVTGDDGQLGVEKATMVEWSGLSEQEFDQLYLSWVDSKSDNPFFHRNRKDLRSYCHGA